MVFFPKAKQRRQTYGPHNSGRKISEGTWGNSSGEQWSKPTSDIPLYWLVYRKPCNGLLLGGFNPFEKYESNWESSPNFGVKIKNIWVAAT